MSIVLASSPDCASEPRSFLLSSPAPPLFFFLLGTHHVSLSIYLPVYVYPSRCIYMSIVLASSPDCASGVAAALLHAVVASPSFLFLTRYTTYLGQPEGL